MPLTIGLRTCSTLWTSPSWKRTGGGTKRQYLQDGALPFSDILTDDFVRQAMTAVEGAWKVKQSHLRPLRDRARALLAPYEEVDLGHVPRALNADADALVNAALDAPER